MSLLSIANHFESLLPDERPYRGTQSTPEGVYPGRRTIADVDVNGNGSVVVDVLPTVRQDSRRVERLVLEDSIHWIGSWTYTDDYRLTQRFTSEPRVDGDSRRLVEEGSGSWIGTYDHRWETTVDVTGEPVEGSDACEVASGTITERYGTNDRSSFSTTTLTLVEGSIDDPWRVTRVHETEGETSVSEYLARGLSMHMIRFGYRRQVSENDGFICDVGDL